MPGGILAGRPLLWAMLTDDLWDDGSARLRGTLLVLVDGGTVKLWLNDRACERAAWVSGESLDDALDALEGGLYANALAWRSQAASKHKKK